MASSLAFTITMGCTKGHRIEVDEDTARSLNATSCAECRRPLLAVSVRAKGPRQVERRRCPNHANGDPVCKRQGGAA
jgi:hypothetical protein